MGRAALHSLMRNGSVSGFYKAGAGSSSFEKLGRRREDAALE